MSHLLHAVEPWADLITANLWRASWQGAIAIAAAWAIVRCYASMSPRVVSWVWRLVCLKLLVALVWFQPVSLAVLTPERVPVVATSVTLSETPATTLEPLESVPAPEQVVQPVMLAAQPSLAVPLSVWLASLWLAGVGCGMAITFRQWRLVHRLRRSCEPLSSPTLDQICSREAARLGMRRIPLLYVSPLADSPLLTGIVRPAIILPTSALHAFDAGEMRVLIAHELGHLKRHDLAWNWLATLAGWSFFFHPLVWLLMRHWSEAQEAACDELLLQSHVTRPAEYGRLLLKSVMHWPQARRSTLVSAGVLGAYRNLERRILSMTRVKPTSARRIATTGCMLMIVALIGIVPWRLVAREVDGAHDEKANTGAETRPTTDEPSADKPEQKPADDQPDAGSSNSLARPSTAIYVMRPDGSGERKVVSIEGASSHLSPRWSHDGKRLAFEVIDDRVVRKSFVVNLDGTDLKEVAQLGRPDWSPDDKQLVLDSDDWNTSAIFVQNVGGGVRIRLADGAWPRWSRDGSKIAFCQKTALKVLDLEKGGEHLLYEGAFVQRPGAFDWSRDGGRLALFTRTVDGGPRELYIINADGTSKDIKPRYSRPGMVGGHVTWSPDDKQLIFTVDSMIHTLEVEGNAEPRLVPNQSDENRDPAVSPDGKWIAFVRRPILSALHLK